MSQSTISQIKKTIINMNPANYLFIFNFRYFLKGGILLEMGPMGNLAFGLDFRVVF